MAMELCGILLQYREEIAESAADSELWSQFIGVANQAGITCQQMVDDLGISAGTPERWRDGRSSPHPELGKRVVDYVFSRLMRAKEPAST